MTSRHWIYCWGALLAYMAAGRGDKEINPTSRSPYHELSKQIFTINNKGGLFGYSIAYQTRLKSLVVGAPQDNDIGQVYLCPIETNSAKCDKVPHDRTTIIKSAYLKNNHSLWLGATVNAGESFFMACAPRFNEKIKDFVHTSGRCYYKQAPFYPATNMLSMIEIPLNNKKQYNKDTYIKICLQYSNDKNTCAERPEWLTDTLGLSTYVSKDKIFVGGPAMSIGRTIVYNDIKTVPELIPVKHAELKERSVFFNFGYSMTSGNFELNTALLAISTPYGTIGYGRIYFYTYEDLKHEPKAMWIDGVEVAHVGSLFGASLASLPRSEEISALLVGAPAFAPSSSYNYDVGAVFIYDFRTINSFDTIPVKIKTLLVGTGNKNGGYFGASIITIGDFDGDEIQEVAIAAPLEDEGRGTVYLYSGKQLLDSSTGSRVPWLQKLQPKAGPAQYFGWSLTAAADSDQNGCNELAIGAPGIDSVTLFRCMASVQVYFTFPKLELTKQAAELKTSSSSYTFAPCLNVKYPERPDPATIESNATFSIEIIHPDVTIQNSNKDGKIIFIEYLKSAKLERCETVSVLLPQGANYDQKIMFKLSVNLTENPLERTQFNPRLVLLNYGTGFAELYSGPSLPGSNITIQVHTSLRDGYLIGSTENETLTISMFNGGNKAHEPCVRTRLRGVTVSQISAGRLCSLVNNELKCTIPTLESGASWTSEPIILSTKHLTSADQQIEIECKAFTSHCSQSTNHTYAKTIGLTRDSSIVIRKTSTPSFIVSVTKQELGSDRGKIIEHSYEITNNGTTRWANVSCEVVLPPQVQLEKITVASEKCFVKEHKAFCKIKELRKNWPIQIKIRMQIQPDSPFVDLIKQGKATVDTKLILMLTESRTEKITTILMIWEAAKVPLWMIIVAVLVGILLVVLLLWALHECGCMKRENKQKLQQLKKDVHRQSVRKSMMLRQSIIEVVTSGTEDKDRQRLISVPEEDATSHDGGLHDHQNVFPVKEKHKDDDDDPARIAFNAELAKALAKGKKTVVTEAEIH